MKNHLIYFFILFQAITFKTNAQVSGSYWCNPKMGLFNSFNLVLFNNNTYYCELADEGDDDINGIPFSYGTYKLSHDTIILTDMLNSYKILIKKRSNKLKIIKSFKWMQSLELNYVGSSTGWIDIQNVLRHQIIRIQTEKNIINKKGSLIDKPKLLLGNYKNQNGLELKLKNNKYEYYRFEGFNISEGTWKQVGNILMLYDSNIRASFKMLITKESNLISSFLPANFVDMTFKKYP